jgi:hypothetical protein
LQVLRNATSSQPERNAASSSRRALLATPLSEGVMRPGFPASAAGVSTVGADADTLKLAVRCFLALCKAEHVAPADILFRFDIFLAEYNARQKRTLLWPNQADCVE